MPDKVEHSDIECRAWRERVAFYETTRKGEFRRRAEEAERRLQEVRKELEAARESRACEHEWWLELGRVGCHGCGVVIHARDLMRLVGELAGVYR